MIRTEFSRRDLERAGEPICPQLPGKWLDRRCGGGGGGKGASTPPPPDYTGAAQAQGQSSKEVTNMQTYANRPTQNTPWGSVTWGTKAVTDPATGQPVTAWTQNYNLTPTAQKALDSQLAVQQGRSDLAASFMDRVNNEYSKPFDWNNLPATGRVDASPDLAFSFGNAPQLNTQLGLEGSQRVGQGPMLNSYMRANPTQTRMNFNDNGALQATDDAARQRIEQGLFDRMSPMHERQQTSLEVKLANQGITPGSVAYKRAMQDLGDRQSRERYDALQTAGQEIQRNQQMALGNRQQLTNEDISGANLFNSGNQQGFNQRLAASEFGNKATQDMWNNLLAGTNLNNAASNQDYNQRLGALSFGNTAMQNQQALDLARMGFNNQAATQQQALDIANANYQNQLRQQAIAEQMQRRGMSLNEMNAVLTGQQVGMQQMPNFNTAARSDAVDYMGAAKLTNDYNWDKYNADQQAANSKAAGTGQIIGAAAGALMFSDSRLKKILGKIGKIGDFNLYRFKYLGSDTIHEGVIAQEVQKVRPDLVVTHPNGYLMVNYAGLEI